MTTRRILRAEYLRGMIAGLETAVESSCVYCRFNEPTISGRHTGRGQPFCQAVVVRRLLKEARVEYDRGQT